MGSSNSTMDDSDAVTEGEYALIEASEITRQKDQTAVFGMQKQRPKGGLAFGAPKYASKTETRVPVRIVGWGYGRVTHSFTGLPVNQDCATGTWETPDLQDNTTYFIVSLVWPKKREIWIQASAARQLVDKALVTGVTLPRETVLTQQMFHGLFTLPPTSLVHLSNGKDVALSDMPAAQQATINFTYSSCVVSGKR